MTEAFDDGAFLLVEDFDDALGEVDYGLGLRHGRDAEEPGVEFPVAVGAEWHDIPLGAVFWELAVESVCFEVFGGPAGEAMLEVTEGGQEAFGVA